MIFIEIPFKTPTINHAYWHKGYTKVLKTEAKKLREIIEDIVSKIHKEDVDLLFNERLKVEVDVYEDWLTQDGSIKKKDVMNREKFLIDSIFNALDIDDSQIYDITFKKCQNDEREFSHVRIYVEDGL